MIRGMAAEPDESHAFRCLAPGRVSQSRLFYGLDDTQVARVTGHPGDLYRLRRIVNKLRRTTLSQARQCTEQRHRGALPAYSGRPGGSQRFRAGGKANSAGPAATEHTTWSPRTQLQPDRNQPWPRALRHP